jgi:uncharacterized protein YbjT (DUF2867 family)
MSVVLVTGGTGTLGRSVVSLLGERGHEVRVLSRRPGAGSHQGDLRTGKGLVEAAAGVDLVVHAASDTHRMGWADLDQTRNLLRALDGARHLVYVSIVGIDAIPFGYYRRKLACEHEIESSGIPYTIARATQFHELIALALRAFERLPVAPLPLDFRFQPVAAAEVGDHVAGLVAGDPTGRAADFGGPEVLTLGEMARTWRSQRGRPRRLWRVPVPGRVGGGFRAGLNTCVEQASGVQRWQDFVRLQGS